MKMQNAGFSPRRFVFNTVIKACDGHPKKAEEYYRKMKAAGHEPNFATFGKLMYIFAMLNDTARASYWWKEMQKAAVVPNVVTYSIMINAFRRVGKITDAIQWFRDMKRANIEPDIVSYTTMIEACGQVGNVVDALQLFEDMIHDGLVPNVFTYNAIISAYAQAKNVTDAINWMEKMKQAGLVPTAITYNIICTAFIYSGDIIQAEIFLHDILEKNPLILDAITFDPYLKYYSKARDRSGFINTFYCMIKYKIVAEQDQWNMLEEICGSNVCTEFESRFTLQRKNAPLRARKKKLLLHSSSTPPL